jgi:Zn-dependent protease
MYFMQNRQNMTPADVACLLLGYAALILFIMPAHELAHAYVAHLCGDDTAKWNGRLTLNPFKHLEVWGTVMLLTVGIGYAKPVPVISRNFRKYKRDMILVALAGPLSNLLMAVAAVGIFRVSLFFVTDIAVLNALWLILINVIASVNISLAVFNLLPIPPLDGSRLWSSLLPTKWSYTIERYSQYITMALFVLLMTGVLDGPLSVLKNAVFNVLFTLFGM